MKLWQALKSALRFPSWGGQGMVRGGIQDWVTWSGHQPYVPTDIGPYWRNGVVMACVAWLMRAFPEPPVQVVREDEDGEENEVPKHPLTQLFKRPNNFYGADCLWQRVVFDLCLYGQAFIYKDRSQSGEVVALWHIPQSRLVPQWGSDGRTFIDSYLFTVDARQEQIPTKDLVHFRFGGDPEHERIGLATLKAATREIATINEGANYRAGLLRRMGVPSHLLQTKDPANPINAAQATALHALWQSRVCGGERGGVLIPNFPLEAVKIGMSPSELDIGRMTFEATDLTCSLFGLNAMLLGLSSGSEHKTYANYAEARESGVENGLIPRWKQAGQDVTLQLLPDFSDDRQECVEFDLTNVRALQEDENALYGRLDKAVNTGWVTVNEARAKVNLPPIDGGDVMLPARGEVPVNLAMPPGVAGVPGAMPAQAAPPQPAMPNGNGRGAAAGAR